MAVIFDGLRTTDNGLGLIPTPLHKPFQGKELRQTQGIVDLGRVLVSILGPLPELTPVRAAGEHGPVFLRLVPEDGLLFPLQVAGTQGDHPFEFVRLPFLPGAPVQPDLERLAGFFPHFPDSLENGIATDAVGAMGVGQFAGHIDLGRL